MSHSIWKSPKGTELPILYLRGKDYLEVKWRLVWFREEHPDWSIETEFHSHGPDWAWAKATIKDATGRILATAHKFEDKAGFPDFREKSETSAVGRALAMIGYGTQFCSDELDEGQRLADSPTEKRVSLPAPKQSQDHVPFRIEGSQWDRRAIGEIPEPEIRRELERLELIQGPSEDQLRTMDRMREHLRGLAASGYPKCLCGSELKISKHGRTYHCPAFLKPGQHVKPIEKAEYEGAASA